MNNKYDSFGRDIKINPYEIAKGLDRTLRNICLAGNNGYIVSVVPDYFSELESRGLIQNIGDDLSNRYIATDKGKSFYHSGGFVEMVRNKEKKEIDRIIDNTTKKAQTKIAYISLGVSVIAIIISLLTLLYSN